MTPQGDTDPPPEILPVTEDMLLTEEEVERLIKEAPGPFELNQAVLHFGESTPAPLPPATTVSNLAEMTDPPAASAQYQNPPQAGRSGSQAPAKKPAARARRSSGARWIFLAMAVLCLAGAGVWLALPPAAPPVKKQGAADLLAQAGTLSTPAAAAGIMASDSFDYPHKSELKGQAGGSGWAGPWSGAKAVIAPASLAAGQTAPGGAGGHVSLEAAQQVILARPYAKSVAVPDPELESEWWVSLLISHTGGAAGDGGELWLNFFSATNINEVIRLTLSEKGRTLQLLKTGNDKPVALPGEPGSAHRIVARIKVHPTTTAGKFDFLMDVWVNPEKADALPKPVLSVPVKKIALPGRPGFSMQKQLQKAPGETRLGRLIIGNTAAAVMK